MIAVDTNILVYAHREDSPHHGAAARVLRELGTSQVPWAVPWPCVHEFLAIVTHQRIYRPPTPLDDAVAAVNALVGAPRVELIGEVSRHAEILGGLLRAGHVSGAKVHDARIAAICLGHGVDALWSSDRDFSWFPELRVVNPLLSHDG